MTTTAHPAQAATTASVVNSVVAAQATALAALATGATDAYPHAGLPGNLDAARDRYVAAGAAQAVLAQMRTLTGEQSLLDAALADTAPLAIPVMHATRGTVAFVLGEHAGAPVDAILDALYAALAED